MYPTNNQHTSQAGTVCVSVSPATITPGVYRDDRRSGIPHDERREFQVIGTALYIGSQKEILAMDRPLRASHFDFPMRTDAISIHFGRDASNHLRFYGDGVMEAHVVIFRPLKKYENQPMGYLFLSPSEFDDVHFTHVRDQ